MRQADSQAAERLQACQIQADLHRKLCRCPAPAPVSLVAGESRLLPFAAAAATMGVCANRADPANEQLPAPTTGIAACECGAMHDALAALQACVDAGAVTIRTKRGKRGGAGCAGGGVARQQQGRIAALRLLRVRLGLLDPAAETEAARTAEKARDEHARRRAAAGRRKRARFAASLDDTLHALRDEVTQRHTVLPTMCLGPNGGAADGGALPPPRIDWEAVPLVLRPSSCEGGCLGNSGKARVRHKEWQLESLFTVLRSVLTTVQQNGRQMHVVDFGSGCGNSVLPFASLLPEHRFTVS